MKPTTNITPASQVKEETIDYAIERVHEGILKARESGVFKYIDLAVLPKEVTDRFKEVGFKVTGGSEYLTTFTWL